MSKEIITTRVYGHGVYTVIKEMRAHYDYVIKNKIYLNRGEIGVVIENATYWENGEATTMVDHWEDCDNARMIATRILPKLIRKGIIRKSGFRTERYTI